MNRKNTKLHTVIIYDARELKVRVRAKNAFKAACILKRQLNAGKLPMLPDWRVRVED